MGVFLVFSDESGAYQKVKSDRFLKRYPFYCRSAIVLATDDWMALRKCYVDLKNRFNIDDDTELKWDYIWQKRKHPDKFEATHPELAHLSSEDMLFFVEMLISAMLECESCQLVFTVTENDSVRTYTKNKVWEMHLEDLMQRVEMQVNGDRKNLAIFFLDNNEEGEKGLRERYSELVKDGVFLEYRHIKDSLAFEYSHHSYAMQMADFCVGAFTNMLRGYQESSSLFKMLYPKIVKSRTEEVMGFGVCDVPTDKQGARLRIKRRIEEAVKLT